MAKTSMVERDPEWAGWSSVLVNLNDLAAMGATPSGLLDAVSGRDGSFVSRVLAGLRAAADAFDVVIPSMPGYGFSDRSPRTYDVGLFVDAVHDMLDLIAADAGPEPVDALAISLSSEFLARVATRLLAKLRVPVNVEGHELVVSASMGVSLLPDNAREISALVSQANMAMQHAKHLGGNNFQFFTDSLQASTLERLQLENHLRKAIDERQLTVFYQPKLCLVTGKLKAAEALVRWEHPQWGMVPPSDFIGLAEETGLIVPLGEFVLRQACWQACEWQRQGLAPIRVSVNLSVHQLRQGKLVSLVRQVLEETALDPQYLELELTESQLLDSVEHIIATFQQLRDLGVKLAIDDFGTGYSSLSYLKRIPVDYVKIDQAFIRGLGQGREDAAITRAIIAMAHGLALKVVAEGVEDQQQLDFLRGEQCDEVQGYLISPPMRAEGLADLLRKNADFS